MKRIVSDRIDIGNHIYATVEIERNTKNVSRLHEKITNVKDHNRDNYAIFKKSLNLKMFANENQIINIVGIECYICYDEKLVHSFEDSLLYLHESLGPSFIAAKLAIIYKKKKKSVKIEPLFFKNLHQFFKLIHFDKIGLTELYLMSKHIKNSEDTQHMTDNAIHRKDGCKSIIFDISKHFAYHFLNLSDEIKEA